MYPFAKRLFDRALAAALLVVFLPVLVALALLVLTGGGPLFAREERVSRGRTFGLLKFRTERPDGQLTWAGRTVLRRWYLDELPQLLNILRGDITFVGPRPWPPSMVAQQIAEGLDYRTWCVCGLTGAAQVTKGVPGTRYADLDLEYIAQTKRLTGRRLVRYDVGILVRTLRVLARGEGLTY